MDAVGTEEAIDEFLAVFVGTFSEFVRQTAYESFPHLSKILDLAPFLLEGLFAKS
jgi:hypothetical protein